MGYSQPSHKDSRDAIGQGKVRGYQLEGRELAGHNIHDLERQSLQIRGNHNRQHNFDEIHPPISSLDAPLNPGVLGRLPLHNVDVEGEAVDNVGDVLGPDRTRNVEVVQLDEEPGEEEVHQGGHCLDY